MDVHRIRLYCMIISFDAQIELLSEQFQTGLLKKIQNILKFSLSMPAMNENIRVRILLIYNQIACIFLELEPCSQNNFTVMVLKVLSSGQWYPHHW